MTPDEIANCRVNLFDFVTTMFSARRGGQFKENWHQQSICNALERVVLGRCPRLVINIPPRSGKTELAVVNFIAWCMGNWPSSEFIHASYSKRLATANTYSARALMQSDLYRGVFPWTALKEDSRAKDEFRTDQGGIVYATGSDGTITGYGAGKMSDGFGGCFPVGTKVWTEHGLLPIDRIVRDRLRLRIWAYDYAGQMVLRPVTGWHENPPNNIVRVTMDDGAAVECTPDHRFWTDNRGWVRADSLCKDDLLPAVHGGVEGLDRIGINADGGSGGLNTTPVFPASPVGAVGEREVGLRLSEDGAKVGSHASLVRDWPAAGDRPPSVAAPYLVDDADVNAVAGGEIGSGDADGIVDCQRVVVAEQGDGVNFSLAERAVGLAVRDVAGAAIISEVRQPIVGRVAVSVANIGAGLLGANEGPSDSLVDVDRADLAADREVDPEVSLPVIAGFQDALGKSVGRPLAVDHAVLATDAPEVADRVEPFVSGYRKPILVERIRHDAVTFCLTVKDYHNFTVEQGLVVKNCIIVDDPHKAGEATSEVMRANVIDWFQTTMESRKNKPETPIIIIMQRLHEDDLSGFLLNGGNGEEWEHLCIPAIDVEGEPFWPEQFPLDDLRRQEAANPYVFAGQMMQRPAPKGGGMFPVDRFQVVQHAPTRDQIADSMRYWDKAGTAGGGAFTAGVLIHRLKDGRFCIADVQRFQLGVLDRDRRIKQTAEIDGRDIRVAVEQEPGSGGKESAEATIRMLSGWNVIADRPSGEKDVRAEPYAAQVQGSNVQIVSGVWNRAFLDEHEMFPNGKFKDQVDAAAAGFNLLAGGSTYDITAWTT